MFIQMVCQPNPCGNSLHSLQVLEDQSGGVCASRTTESHFRIRGRPDDSGEPPDDANDARDGVLPKSRPAHARRAPTARWRSGLSVIGSPIGPGRNRLAPHVIGSTDSPAVCISVRQGDQPQEVRTFSRTLQKSTKFLRGHLAVAEDLRHQPRSQSFTGVHGDDRRPFHRNVAGSDGFP